MTDTHNSLPLRGLRALDLCAGLGDGCGRYLADLGAEVILVEAPGGSAARVHPPLVDGQSTWFAVQAANKLSVELDVNDTADRAEFAALAATGASSKSHSPSINKKGHPHG